MKTNYSFFLLRIQLTVCSQRALEFCPNYKPVLLWFVSSTFVTAVALGSLRNIYGHVQIAVVCHAICFVTQPAAAAASLLHSTTHSKRTTYSIKTQLHQKVDIAHNHTFKVRVSEISMTSPSTNAFSNEGI
jgi:hypothetical protein